MSQDWCRVRVIVGEEEVILEQKSIGDEKFSPVSGKDRGNGNVSKLYKV